MRMLINTFNLKKKIFTLFVYHITDNRLFVFVFYLKSRYQNKFNHKFHNQFWKIDAIFNPFRFEKKKKRKKTNS